MVMDYYYYFVLYVFIFPRKEKKIEKNDITFVLFQVLKKFAIIFVHFHIKEILLGFKFGYMSVRTVEKFGNHVTLWRFDSAYCLNMATSKKSCS
jgi:hypothetical protein